MGTDESLSRAIPISRDRLWEVLNRCSSLRSAASHLSAILGHEVKHQSVMEVLRHDPVLKEYISAEEKRFAEQWPRSATEPYVMEHGWLHSQMRRKVEKLLFQYRWKSRKWPSVKELSAILKSTYPIDRWGPKTPRRKLLANAGIPKDLFDAVFDSLDTKPGGTPGGLSRKSPQAEGESGRRPRRQVVS